MVSTALVGEYEYTPDGYRSFLKQATREYSPQLFSVTPSEGDLFVRHDVSLSLADAAQLARIEAEHGIETTYCLLLGSPLYNPLERESRSLIETIAAAGHDVGIQLDPRAHWETKPATAAVERVVREYQSILGRIVPEPAPVVSFHRPPAWIQHRSFDGFQGALAPEFSTEIEYVSDRSHRDPDLDNYDAGMGAKTLQASIHPSLWLKSNAEYERIVEQSVIEACRTVNRRSREEFIDPQR